MIRIVHISDTHLGNKQFGLPEREDDFKNVFIEACEKIIELKPDLVIHSGDFFELSRPTTRSLKISMSMIDKITSAGIPIFILPGTHDLPKTDEMTESPISLLTFKDNVYDFSQHEKDGFRLTIHIKGKKLSLVGLPYSLNSVKLSQELRKTKVPKGLSILVFHEGVKEIFPYTEISVKDIPPGFDYYAFGHLHNKHILQHPITKKPICCPGSTETNDFSEVGKGGKGFFLVNIGSKTNIKFVELKGCRQFIDLPDVDCTKKDPSAVTSNIIKTIRENCKKGCVLRINVTGRTSMGNYASINLMAAEDFAKKEMGALFVEHKNKTEIIEFGGKTMADMKIRSAETEAKEFIDSLDSYNKKEKESICKATLEYLKRAKGIGD